eukprot:GFYU01002049.1.p1 GENE.GFYU01002049.1~~GFYU01002049.1.p1  ORF type:complete len:640 (+),score=161.07 GFYU01002049.1:174-2093(+)
MKHHRCPSAMSSVSVTWTWSVTMVFTVLAVTAFWIEPTSAWPLKLTNDTFHEEVASHDVAMVAFTHKDCHFCQLLKPEFEDAEEVMRGKALLALVEGTEDSSAPLLEQYDVEYFPRLLVYFNGNQTKEYIGLHTTEDILEYVERQIQPKYKRVDTMKKLNYYLKEYRRTFPVTVLRIQPPPTQGIEMSASVLKEVAGWHLEEHEYHLFMDLVMTEEEATANGLEIHNPVLTISECGDSERLVSCFDSDELERDECCLAYATLSPPRGDHHRGNVGDEESGIRVRGSVSDEPNHVRKWVMSKDTKLFAEITRYNYMRYFDHGRMPVVYLYIKIPEEYEACYYLHDGEEQRECLDDRNQFFREDVTMKETFRAVEEVANVLSFNHTDRVLLFAWTSANEYPDESRQNITTIDILDYATAKRYVYTGDATSRDQISFFVEEYLRGNLTPINPDPVVLGIELAMVISLCIVLSGWMVHHVQHTTQEGNVMGGSGIMRHLYSIIGSSARWIPHIILVAVLVLHQSVVVTNFEMIFLTIAIPIGYWMIPRLRQMRSPLTPTVAHAPSESHSHDHHHDRHHGDSGDCGEKCGERDSTQQAEPAAPVSTSSSGRSLSSLIPKGYLMVEMWVPSLVFLWQQYIVRHSG